MGRSKWKGFFINNNQKLNKKDKLPIINKNENIAPILVNRVFRVHTGKNFSKITLTKEMLGHKIGEFLLTRAKYVFKQKKQKNKINGTKNKPKHF